MVGDACAEGALQLPRAGKLLQRVVTAGRCDALSSENHGLKVIYVTMLGQHCLQNACKSDSVVILFLELLEAMQVLRILWFIINLMTSHMLQMPPGSAR